MLLPCLWSLSASEEGWAKFSWSCGGGEPHIESDISEGVGWENSELDACEDVKLTCVSNRTMSVKQRRLVNYSVEESTGIVKIKVSFNQSVTERTSNSVFSIALRQSSPFFRK